MEDTIAVKNHLLVDRSMIRREAGRTMRMITMKMTIMLLTKEELVEAR